MRGSIPSHFFYPVDMKRLLILCSTLLIGLWAAPLGAQNEADNCRETLDLAAEQMRRPRRVIGMLSDSTFKEDCYPVLSKGDRLRVRRLLAQAYLLLNPPLYDSALVNWEALLKVDPEYQLDTISSPDVLIALSKQFLARPLVSFSFLQGGLHLPIVRSSGNYTTANLLPNADPTSFQAIYSPNLSWQLATAAWLNLNALFPTWSRLLRWEVGLDARYQESHHSFQQRWWWLNDAENVFETRFEEQQTSLGLGLMLRHSFDSRQEAYQPVGSPIIPYLALGARWQHLQLARLSDTRLTNLPNRDDGGTALAEGLSTPRIDALRRPNAWAVSLALGGKYKVDRHYLFVEVGMEYGLTNVVEPSTRYDQRQLLYQYGYVDPDWTTTRLLLNIGFLFTEYQVNRRAPAQQP